MTLAEFMRANSISDQDMAERVGCSEFAVRKWKYGERVPRGAALARLREITQGAVTANDFVPSDIEPETSAA